MVEKTIGPLVKETSPKSREAAKRKRAYEQKAIADTELEQHKQEGWEFSKKLKGHKVRIQKSLSPDIQLENRVWYCFI
jgi:hypothetical protein